MQTHLPNTQKGAVVQRRKPEGSIQGTRVIAYKRQPRLLLNHFDMTTNINEKTTNTSSASEEAYTNSSGVPLPLMHNLFLAGDATMIEEQPPIEENHQTPNVEEEVLVEEGKEKEVVREPSKKSLKKSSRTENENEAQKTHMDAFDLEKLKKAGKFPLGPSKLSKTKYDTLNPTPLKGPLKNADILFGRGSRISIHEGNTAMVRTEPFSP